MTDRPDFPTIPRSVIRATDSWNESRSDVLLRLPDAPGEPQWFGGTFGYKFETDLTLIEVLHDEGYAQLLASLPGWGDLTDVDKGCALQYAAKTDSEGRDYATENYPARFLDHPALTALKPGDACAFVDRFGFELWADGWHSDDDSIVVSVEEDERLCKLADDAERARRRGDAS